MSCPHYQDFTRNCLKEYPTLIRYESIVQCESEDYPICILYHILQNDFRCKHLGSCSRSFPDEIPKFDELMRRDKSIYEIIVKQVYNYCLLNENHMQCARYKIIEEGKQLLPGLIPDGNNINTMGPNITVPEKEMITNRNKT